MTPLGAHPSFAETGPERHRLWLLGLLIACLVSLHAAGAVVRDTLMYQREAVLAGEYWRLLSGHFVHGTAQHLMLNGLGLMLVCALFPRSYFAAEWLLIIAASIVAIGAGFVFYQPQLEWYVGFSGVLHGALAAGVFAWWRQESRPLALALIAVLAGKLAWEQYHGALPLSGDLPVVVDAHLYGAIGGALGASIIWGIRQRWFCAERSL